MHKWVLRKFKKPIVMYIIDGKKLTSKIYIILIAFNEQNCIVNFIF